MIHSSLKSVQRVHNFRSFSLLKTGSNRKTFSISFAKNPAANVAIFYSSVNVPLRRNFHGSFYDQTSEQNTLSSHNINISNPATIARTNTSSSLTDAPASVRTKLRVADVLKAADHQKKFSLPSEATIADAMAHLVKQKLSSSLIIDKQDGSIAGIFTARDLLKSICDHTSTFHPPAATNPPSTPNSNNTTPPTTTPATPTKLADAFPHTEFSQQVIDFMNNTKITDIMTKREKLVYCSPSDSLSHCREIMFQCKIRNLPIIDSNNVVRGILTMKTIADSSFNLIDIGGKKGFIHNVTGRRGLPNTAKVELSSSLLNDAENNNLTNKLFNQLDLEIGSFALPHPFKSERGAANNRRDYGAFQLSTDLKYCEDASFAIRLKELQPTNPLDVTSSSSSTAPESNSNNTGANSNNNLHHVDRSQFHLPLSIVQEPSQVFIAVADGVGSWRQYGIDPREYSHKLIDNARKVIENDHIHRAIFGQMPFDRDVPSIHPLDIILDAWNITTGEGVQGSSTICVATLDKKLNQLSYSNIGDCGLIVLRHIDSETAGYMRDRSLPRHERKTDLKIAYISQQQLRSFNLPYQLGYSKLAESPQVFETPNDADTASIPVMPGDVIILATDGLYDNLELNEIIEEVYKWEKEHFNATTDEDLRYPSKKGNNEAVQNLAERLVKLARDLSLDTHRDSPFAILAKENDIMWGGGMPDDTTVVVGRVVAVN